MLPWLGIGGRVGNVVSCVGLWITLDSQSGYNRGIPVESQCNSRIAGLIEDNVVIVLGLWLAMGASCGLQAFLT